MMLESITSLATSLALPSLRSRIRLTTADRGIAFYEPDSPVPKHGLTASVYRPQRILDFGITVPTNTPCCTTPPLLQALLISFGFSDAVSWLRPWFTRRPLVATDSRQPAQGQALTWTATAGSPPRRPHRASPTSQGQVCLEGVRFKKKPPCVNLVVHYKDARIFDMNTQRQTT